MTGALSSLLKAFIILVMWLAQTFRMVLCVVHVLTMRTRKNALPGKSFTPTCFGKVLCLAIIVGPSTKKEGVMMEDKEEEEDDDMYPEYGDTAMGELKMKGHDKLKMKRHQMSPLMIFVGPSLMHTEKQKV
jgi:hypothetical protein